MRSKKPEEEFYKTNDKVCIISHASESMQAGLSSSYTLIGSGTGFPLVVPRRKFHQIQSPNGRGSYRFNPAAHHILVIYSAIKKASKVLKLSAVVRVPTHHNFKIHFFCRHTNPPQKKNEKCFRPY